VTNIKITGHPTQHAHTCPACGAPIRASAIVEAFGQPDDWQFWGEPGNRWRRCEGRQNGYRYVHFIAGQVSRLAWSKEV
jgi:hypothetical protein